jgi:hypothetical protein
MSNDQGLLPIMSPLYNLREICKQIVLLEDHLNQPRKRCPDCIRKHFLTIEALFEEAVSLDKELKYIEVLDNKAEEIRKLQSVWLDTRDNEQAHRFYLILAQALRVLRKSFAEHCFDVRKMASMERKASLYVCPHRRVANKPPTTLKELIDLKPNTFKLAWGTPPKKNMWNVSWDERSRVSVIYKITSRVLTAKIRLGVYARPNKGVQLEVSYIHPDTYDNVNIITFKNLSEQMLNSPLDVLMGFVWEKVNWNISTNHKFLLNPNVRVATKTEAEKEDEAVEKLIRKSPKKKPPRKDLRKNRVEISDDQDLQGVGRGDSGDPDLSRRDQKMASRITRLYLSLRG